MESVIIQEKKSPILLFFLLLFAVFIAYGLLAPAHFQALFSKPEHYLKAKFIHIISTTLVFSVAVIGTLWEMRAVASKDIFIIQFVFKTVTWFDAYFTAPLIFFSLCSGILMGTTLGGIWKIGWLSYAFILYCCAGIAWVLFDIPMQYQIKNELNITSQFSGSKLESLLKRRTCFNICTWIPFIIIFYLMIIKPELLSIAEVFTK